MCFISVTILLLSFVSFSLATNTVPFGKPATYISEAKNGAPCITIDPDTGTYLLFSTTNGDPRVIYKVWSNDINTTTWYDSTNVFNDGSTWCHCILKYPNGTAAKVNGDYWMFYSGGNGDYIRSANPSTTGNLNSSSWTYNATVGSIVLKGDHAWHVHHVGKLGVAAMLEDDGTVVVIYEGNTMVGEEGLGLARSYDDCANWDIYSGNPFFTDTGNTLDWDGGSIDYPTLTKYENTYVMLYCGQNDTAPYDPGEWTPEQVGVITSTDLENWTRLETVYEPIFYPNGTNPNDLPYDYGPHQGWDYDGTSDISHFFIGDKMYLFYEGETPYYVGFAWFDDFFVNIGIQKNEEIQFISIDGGTNGTTTFDSTPTFNWTRVDDTSQYWLQIDNNADFSSPEVNITDINQYLYPSHYSENATRVSFTLPNPISNYDKYYCRVKAYTKS